MNIGSIYFFSEEIKYSLPKKKKTREWIRQTTLLENRSIGNLNIIFCNDNYLRNLNRKYLHSNLLTDIITFDFSESENQVSGDIFISLERVRENSNTYRINFLSELNRVIIHGVLHLIGYDDNTNGEAAIMRAKEDYYLSLRS